MADLETVDVDDLSTSTALAKVVGVTAGGVTQGRAIADFSADLVSVDAAADAIATSVYARATELETNTLTSVIGLTGAGAANKRTLANLTNDLLATSDVPAAIGAGATYLPSGTGAVATTLQNKLRTFVSVKDYGAVGDGTTNDTVAFQRAAAVINAADGGVLFIPPGTYVLGSQTLAGATGLNYSYTPADIIKIENCSNPVLISCYGAKLVAASGLKFGSFDPVTGESYTPSMPFTNYDYRAGAYIFFNVLNNESVAIEGVVVDGGVSTLTLGGQWGDTGYQCVGYGLLAMGNNSLTIRDSRFDLCGLDGVAIGYAGLTAASTPKPSLLVNVHCEHNARQGLSWVGGIGLTAINCVFSNTGKTRFSSAPGAGVDVEAESSVCRDGLFINCYAENNTGAGIVADTGDTADVVWRGGRIHGTTAYAIWITKPRFSFEGAEIVGSCVGGYSDSTWRDTTRLTRCKIHDERLVGGTVYGKGVSGAMLLNSPDAPSLIIDKCNIIARWMKVGNVRSCHIKDTVITTRAGTDIVSDTDWYVLLDGATLDGLDLAHDYASNTPSNYHVAQIAATEKVLGRIRILGAKISMSGVEIGVTGDIANQTYWSRPRNYFSDSSPDVSGVRAIALYTDGGAWTLTALDNGSFGQTVLVGIVGANITVDFSASSLKGNNGVDWTPSAGDAMLCTNFGTSWYCTIIDA